MLGFIDPYNTNEDKNLVRIYYLFVLIYVFRYLNFFILYNFLNSYFKVFSKYDRFMKKYEIIISSLTLSQQVKDLKLF